MEPSSHLETAVADQETKNGYGFSKTVTIPEDATPGDHTIVAQTAEDSAKNQWQAPASFEVTEVSPQPADVTLAPQEATNHVGDSHTVTATVSDQQGESLGGVTVEFSVSGANSAWGRGDTEESGEASFTYTGDDVGEDAITVFADADADADGDCDRDDDEPSDEASVTWLPGRGAPAPPEDPGLPELPALPAVPGVPGLPGTPEPPGESGAQEVTVAADVDAEGLVELCATADGREHCEEFGRDASGEVEATVAVSRDAADGLEVATEDCPDGQDGVVLALSGLEAGAEVEARFHGEVLVDGETQQIDERVGPVEVGASGQATASVCASASADAGGGGVDTGGGSTGGLLGPVDQPLRRLFG